MAHSPETPLSGPGGARTTAYGSRPHCLTLDSAIHDPASQQVDSMHTLIRPMGGMDPVGAPLRLARRIGSHGATRWSRAQHRRGGWGRQPFTAGSNQHVSAWRKLA